MMSELSEKDKALKAVLTMWNAIYNPPEFNILPNDIYKARKLIEEIIEDHYQPANHNVTTETHQSDFTIREQVITQGGEVGYVVDILEDGAFLLIDRSKPIERWHKSQVYKMLTMDNLYE